MSMTLWSSGVARIKKAYMSITVMSNGVDFPPFRYSDLFL